MHFINCDIFFSQKFKFHRAYLMVNKSFRFHNNKKIINFIKILNRQSKFQTITSTLTHHPFNTKTPHKNPPTPKPKPYRPPPPPPTLESGPTHDRETNREIPPTSRQHCNVDSAKACGQHLYGRLPLFSADRLFFRDAALV